MKILNGRTTEYDIEDIFLQRYSPRAMSGESVSKKDVLTLIDAARWAPSAFNAQPWRFLYITKGANDFDLFLSFLNEKNQTWCKNAGAFIIVLSKTTNDDGIINDYSSFDTGAACENLALQGVRMNLVTHAMAGFNSDILRKSLDIKNDYNINIMVAVGKKGNAEELPEYLKAIEKPNDRKNLNDICFEGTEGAKKL